MKDIGVFFSEEDYLNSDYEQNLINVVVAGVAPGSNIVDAVKKAITQASLGEVQGCLIEGSVARRHASAYHRDQLRGKHRGLNVAYVSMRYNTPKVILSDVILSTGQDYTEYRFLTDMCEYLGVYLNGRMTMQSIAQGVREFVRTEYFGDTSVLEISDTKANIDIMYAGKLSIPQRLEFENVMGSLNIKPVYRAEPVSIELKN